jgi:hypothetical protein
MQYLTRVILSGLSPRSLVQSQKTRIALVLLTIIVAVLLAVRAVPRLTSGGHPIQKELGLKPLRATDENGGVWVMEPAAAQPFARLREKQAKPGPPLLVRTEVQRTSAEEISIGLLLEGQAGERYLPGISRDGVRLPAPAFTVVNEAGQVIHKDQFKYG